VGVQTPRGTGTNGHVSSNRAKVPKYKTQQPILTIVQPFDWGENKEDILAPPVHRLPNPEILEMDRKRQLENKVYEWAEKEGILDNDKITPDELEEMLSKQREIIIKEDEMKKLRSEEDLKKMQLEENAFSKFREDRIAYFNTTSSHRQQQMKSQQSSTFAEALGIKDYSEGEAFNEFVQDQKKQEKMEKMIEREKEKIKKRRRKEKKEKKREMKN